MKSVKFFSILGLLVTLASPVYASSISQTAVTKIQDKVQMIMIHQTKLQVALESGLEPEALCYALGEMQGDVKILAHTIKEQGLKNSKVTIVSMFGDLQSRMDDVAGYCVSDYGNVRKNSKKFKKNFKALQESLENFDSELNATY